MSDVINKKTFSVPSENIKVKTVDKNFLIIDIYAISDGVNNNMSEFLSDSFEPSIPSFYNKPILAYFNNAKGDVEEHNSKLSVSDTGELFEDFNYEGGERPVGLIPESASVVVEKFKGRNWIKINGAIIWSNYARQISDLIRKKKQNKVSVEVSFLDFYEENGIEKVKLFDFWGVTMLGDEYGTGIEHAHLTLREAYQTENFQNYKHALCFALKDKSSADKISVLSKYGKSAKTSEEECVDFASNLDYGTGETVTVDKSKDAVSNDSWGGVNKTALRNSVLKAKNYKSLIRSVYLDVEDGWEDSPSSHLKYPVMQIKGGKAVYNSGGLLSAQQYGEKNDKNIANKALSIRKKLGLLKSDKEAQMKEFIDSAAKQGMSFIGLFGNKLRFIETCQFAEENKEDMVKEEMTVFECDGNMDLEENFKLEECTQVKMTEYSEDEDVEEDKDDKEDSEDKEEMAKDEKECDFTEEFEATKAELAAVKEELAKMKKQEFDAKVAEVFANEEDKTDEKTKKELSEMTFATFEDFTKEYAYRKFLISEQKRKESKIKFSVNTTRNTPNVDAEQNTTAFDRLDRI